MTGLLITDPTSLAVALRSKYVIPGDTLLLRGEIYSGDFISTLNGTAEQPITIQPYEDEHPIIDGNLLINGSYTHWRELEMCYSGWTTRVGDPGKQLNVNGPGTKIINSYIHDLAIVGLWMDAVDAEWYGNVVHNIGCIVDGAGYGHSIYTQNGDGRKLIKHNIMGNPYNWNICCYTEQGRIDNFNITENACYGSERDGILIGGEDDSTGCVMDGNLTYGNRRGYLKYGTRAVTLSASNNYFADQWAPADTVFTVNEGNVVGEVGNRVFVYPNDYQSGRANVIIYNEAGADTVIVDLSGVTGLNIGDTYKLRNAQDYKNDVVTGVLPANKTISVDMRAISHTVAARIGSETTVETTFPAFGAWVVERT